MMLTKNDFGNMVQRVQELMQLGNNITPILERFNLAVRNVIQKKWGNHKPTNSQIFDNVGW